MRGRSTPNINAEHKLRFGDILRVCICSLPTNALTTNLWLRFLLIAARYYIIFGLYCSAFCSRCSDWIFSLPARSAIVHASFSTR